MEEFLKNLTKRKLIAIVSILCENKKNIERIKTIFKSDLNQI